MTVDTVFAKIPVYIRSVPNFVYLFECRCECMFVCGTNFINFKALFPVVWTDFP